jgi:hypothetical protein
MSYYSLKETSSEESFNNNIYRFFQGIYQRSVDLKQAKA